MKRLWFCLLPCLCTAIIVAAQGQPYIDSLQRAYTLARADTSRVRILQRLSGACQNTDPRQGVHYAARALALARSLDWKRGLADVWNTLGNAYISSTQLDSAVVCYEQALSLNTEIGNKVGAAQNLGNLGIIATYRSSYPEALDYLFRALRVFEELNDKQGVATQLGNIGNIYYDQKVYDKALQYDSMALVKYHETGDRDGQAIMLGNMGNIYDELGQYRKALSYDSAAVRLYSALQNKEGVARNLLNMSEVFNHLNDAVNVYASLQQALPLALSLEDRDALGVIYTNLGNFYVRRATDTLAGRPSIAGVPDDRPGCLQLAVSYAQKGIALLQETGNIRSMATAYEVLYQAQRALGNYDAALSAHVLFKKMHDSVYSIDNTEQLAKLETRRALELKNKQIELDRLAVEKKRNERGFFIAGMLLLAGGIGLVFRNYRVQKRLNTQLADEKQKVEQRTDELDATNKELSSTLRHLKETQQQLILTEKQKEAETIRRRIAQDIHDDISSELTRISWVSELAKTKLRGADYKEMPVLLDKLSDSSRETVTKLGEIIWTVNPQNDSLASLLTYMRSHIAKFFTDTAIRYTIYFPEDAEAAMVINPELKRNLYLVMKEALHNVLKYAGASKVVIALLLEDGHYHLSISDNGKGFSPGTIQGSGNGLRNIERRMQQVRGTCDVKSTPGEGTTVSCHGELY